MRSNPSRPNRAQSERNEERRCAAAWYYSLVRHAKPDLPRSDAHMAFHLGRLPPLTALWRARILLQDFPGAFEINNALISNGISRVAICLPHYSGPDPQWIKTNFCLSGLKTHGLVRERSALRDGGASLRGT
jgi:hypothetical protein